MIVDMPVGKWIITGLRTSFQIHYIRLTLRIEIPRVRKKYPGSMSEGAFFKGDLDQDQ